jgi:hypothetical protein
MAHDMLDGIPAETAWADCVMASAAPEDAATLSELAKAHLQFSRLDALATGGTAPAPAPVQNTALTPAGARAAADFAN